MSTTPIDTSTLAAFLAVFTQADTACDLGPSMACIEVDALAGLLRAAGHPAAADAWVREHATADDEGDAHHASATAEFIVPIDPMEQLGCDSCQ